MTLKHFHDKSLEPLVQEIFSLSITKTDLDFKSCILPVCNTSLTYIYGNGQSIRFKQKEVSLKGLMLTGQFNQSYEFSVTEAGNSFGIALKPSALYKLTGLNVSKITNKHLPLIKFSEKLHNLLNPIFIEHEQNHQALYDNLVNTVSNKSLKQNQSIENIDNSLKKIHDKEGMLNTTDLLIGYNYSQKTLETQFKKIVGLTPGKYIRMYRFLKLMKKYESKEIDLKDLIYGYNYYDHSHFNRDFKHLMNQSPKEYFKADNSFLNEYLSK